VSGYVTRWFTCRNTGAMNSNLVRLHLSVSRITVMLPLMWWLQPVLSSNEVDLLRYSTYVDFLVSTFYKVNLYTVLSTCNKVTFSCKYLLSTSLLCSQPYHYRSINMCIILYVSVLNAGYAASVIAVFSGVVS